MDFHLETRLARGLEALFLTPARSMGPPGQKTPGPKRPETQRAPAANEGRKGRLRASPGLATGCCGGSRAGGGGRHHEVLTGLPSGEKLTSLRKQEPQMYRVSPSKVIKGFPGLPQLHLWPDANSKRRPGFTCCIDFPSKARPGDKKPCGFEILTSSPRLTHGGLAPKAVLRALPHDPCNERVRNQRISWAVTRSVLLREPRRRSVPCRLLSSSRPLSPGYIGS